MREKIIDAVNDVIKIKKEMRRKYGMKVRDRRKVRYVSNYYSITYWCHLWHMQLYSFRVGPNVEQLFS